MSLIFRRAAGSLLLLGLLSVYALAQQPAIPSTGFAGLDQYRASRIARSAASLLIGSSHR